MQGFQGNHTFCFSIFCHLGRAVIVATVQCQASHGLRMQDLHPHLCLKEWRPLCPNTNTVHPPPAKVTSSMFQLHIVVIVATVWHWIVIFSRHKILSCHACTQTLCTLLLWNLGPRCNCLPLQSFSSPHSHHYWQIFPPSSIQLVHLSPKDKWQQCRGPQQSNSFALDGCCMASLCTAASWCAATSCHTNR